MDRPTGGRKITELLNNMTEI